MEAWYEQFWAQSWYRNTYLVRHPWQIARQIGGDRDWNNIYDSGCNFACIAMILGVDPARLASELGRQRFFGADHESPARAIDGRRVRLVWDRNAPHARQRALKLTRIWLPQLARRATLELTFAGAQVTTDHAEGKRIVGAARRRGEHVIAGASEHSHLVAGRTGQDFYLWDPDDTSVAVECSLAGHLTLGKLFAYYGAREPIEFWRYTLRRTLHAKRAPARGWRYQR